MEAELKTECVFLVVLLGQFSSSFSQGSHSTSSGHVFGGGVTIENTDLNRDVGGFCLGISTLPARRLFAMCGTLSARWGLRDDESGVISIQAYELSAIPKVNLFALFYRSGDATGDIEEVIPFGLGGGAGIGYMVFRRSYTETYTTPFSFVFQTHTKLYWDHLFLRYEVFCYAMLSKRIGLCAEYSAYHPITGDRLIRISELRIGIAIAV